MAFNPLLKTDQRFRSFGNGYDRSTAFLSIGYSDGSRTNGNPVCDGGNVWWWMFERSGPDQLSLMERLFFTDWHSL